MRKALVVDAESREAVLSGRAVIVVVSEAVALQLKQPAGPVPVDGHTEWHLPCPIIHTYQNIVAQTHTFAGCRSYGKSKPCPTNAFLQDGQSIANPSHFKTCDSAT